jgi:predicted SnoaL-like aldol condensation-catalyzing enzyme
MEVKMKYLAMLSIVIGLFTVGISTIPAKEVKTNLSNKEKVIALLTSIETGDPIPASYINPEKYIQHNLMVGDGLAGFGEVLKQLPQGSAKVRVVRAFQDGDFVFAHTEYNFFGPKIGFDIFRFEDGLIVEHWDNLQEIAANNASGRSQIDGPTKPTDLDTTAANKTLVKAFIRDVLKGANPGRITDYISTERYLQHNPAVADGLEALGKALEAMAKAGTPMIYTENHMVLGEGNFVLAVSEGQFLGKHVAFYDLFRIEDGKIVEHWDTIEEIPPKDKWMNNNGKFGEIGGLFGKPLLTGKC